MIKLEQITEAIPKAFEKLQYTPRGNQVDIITAVLTEFLINGKRNVVLGAPTGIGKSLLGAIISEVIDVLTPEIEGKASLIGMGTNSLSKQYTESFNKLGEYEYFQIMGAANYPCRYMESQPAPPSLTADDCVYSRIHETEQQKYCSGCEFKRAKKMVNITSNLITNYTYFMVAQLISGHLEPRKLHIFDEAHTLSDWYCNFTDVNVTIPLLDKYISELSHVNGKCDNEIAGLVMLKDTIKSGGVGENNYKQVCEILGKIYASCEFTLGKQSELLKGQDVMTSAKYDKLARKYANLKQKIFDMLKGEVEHVFDNSIENTFSVKTVFMADKTETMLSHYNLFMSATITEEYAFDVLKLDKKQTVMIQLPSVFPPENKPVLFLGTQALNYNTLKDPATITELKKQVSAIVAHHPEEKGIILAPSFYLGSQLVYNLKGTTVYEHKSGGNISELIRSFKNHKGSCVLVSPSIFEGTDLPEAAYQIFVKTPFANLSDRRIKYIADNYPHIYQEMTLLKLIQGTGRGVRSPTDTSVSYFLDMSSKKLFFSKMNIWKSHFHIIPN